MPPGVSEEMDRRLQHVLVQIWQAHLHTADLPKETTHYQTYTKDKNLQGIRWETVSIIAEV